MSKYAVIALVVVILACGGLFIYWHNHTPQPPDCAFTGWKRSVGVEIETQVKDLDTVKGEIGITDSQVRDFDDLMKDYALKYDAACQDVRAQRITKDEYQCLRLNMEKILDEDRNLAQALTAAKSVSDPVTQRQIVLRALDDIQSASQAKFRSGCASAMTVGPKVLTFESSTPERSIQISNGGNSDFTYSIDGLPEAFDPKPNTGSVGRGASVSVAILRTILPPPPSRISFHIRTNFQDDAEVEIAMDPANASLWNDLGKKTNKAAKGSGPTVQDALSVIDASLTGDRPISEADRLYFAANALFSAGADTEAELALNLAAKKDQAISRQPSTLILAGLIANRQQDPNKALKLFAQVGKSAPTRSDADAKRASELFSGTIMVSQGKTQQAIAILDNPGVQKAVNKNPPLLDFSAQEFCPARKCVAVLSNDVAAAKSKSPVIDFLRKGPA